MIVIFLITFLSIACLVYSNITLHALTEFCDNMMWLHPPKTSSSLCLTLDNICCHNHFQEVFFNISTETLKNLGQSDYKNNNLMKYDPGNNNTNTIIIILILILSH